MVWIGVFGNELKGRKERGDGDRKWDMKRVGVDYLGNGSGINGSLAVCAILLDISGRVFWYESGRLRRRRGRKGRRRRL